MDDMQVRLYDERITDVKHQLDYHIQHDNAEQAKHWAECLLVLEQIKRLPETQKE